MNYYTAKQRKLDEKWDYTVNNMPIGYCQEYKDPDDYPDWLKKCMRQAEIDRIRSFKDKHHTHGHTTQEEACNCYKEYMLDNYLSVGREDSSSQHKCKKCNEWTQGLAGVGGYHLWNLCEKHQTREIISEFYDVGESWES